MPVPPPPQPQNINFPTGTYQYGNAPTGQYAIPNSVFPNSPQAPSTPASNTTPLSTIGNPNSGFWIGVALFAGIGLSGTQVSPLIFGLLSVGLIYQLNQLLQGK